MTVSQYVDRMRLLFLVRERSDIPVMFDPRKLLSLRGRVNEYATIALVGEWRKP